MDDKHIMDQMRKAENIRKGGQVWLVFVIAIGILIIIGLTH